jgi:hypothetical protein
MHDHVGFAPTFEFGICSGQRQASSTSARLSGLFSNSEIDVKLSELENSLGQLQSSSGRVKDDGLQGFGGRN